MAKDMTSGNPMKLISRFTLPLLIGNVFQQFYNMADTYFVVDIFVQDLQQLDQQEVLFSLL